MFSTHPPTTRLSSLLVCVLLSLTSHQLAAGQASSASTTASTTAPAGPAGGSSVSSLTAGLSGTCQAAAGSLLTSEFSACANVIGLVSVIGAQGSVVIPLQNWISGICSSSPCSSSVISSSSNTINQGCSSDVQRNVPSAIALSSLFTNYNAVRDMLCTQYSSNSTYCVPFVLSSIQNATGKSISLEEVKSLVTGGMSAMTLSSVPPSAYCNDCGHAILTQSGAVSVQTASASNATTASTGVNSAFSSACGASFADGKLPSTVRIAGSSASVNAKSVAGQERVSYATLSLVGLLGLAGVSLV